MAPRYKSASTRLSLAEAAAASLVSTLGAEAVDGTLQALQNLLERPNGKPVALLVFHRARCFRCGQSGGLGHQVARMAT